MLITVQIYTNMYKQTNKIHVLEHKNKKKTFFTNHFIFAVR